MFNPSLPMKAFRTKPALVDPIRSPSPYANNFVILHADVNATTVAAHCCGPISETVLSLHQQTGYMDLPAQDTSALNPLLRLFNTALIYPCWPFVLVWCPWTPHVLDSITSLACTAWRHSHGFSHVDRFELLSESVLPHERESSVLCCSWVLGGRPPRSTWPRDSRPLMRHIVTHTRGRLS